MTSGHKVTGFICETTLVDQERRTSLIGILPGRVEYPQYPVNFSCGVFLRVNPLPAPGVPVQIKITLDENIIVDVEGKSVAPEDGPANEFGLDALHINLARLNFTVNEPGILKVFVSAAGETPVLASALRFTLSSAPEKASE